MTTAATARETENPYLNGNYAPVREEITAIDLDVSGTIPDYLDGRFCASGRIRWEIQTRAAIR